VRVTAVGDCGVDRYLDLGRDRPGGITLNFAANARRLFPAGDNVGVVTALGTDSEAGLVRRAIAALGLDACVAEIEGATSIQYIDRHPSGEKIFDIPAGAMGSRVANSPSTMATPATDPGPLTHISIQILMKAGKGPNPSRMMW
jgi:sugar/nucleoside kinase (ribokinase family)